MCVSRQCLVNCWGRKGRLTQRTRSPFSTGPAPAVCFLQTETVCEDGICLRPTWEKPPSLSRCQTMCGRLWRLALHFARMMVMEAASQ